MVPTPTLPVQVLTVSDTAVCVSVPNRELTAKQSRCENSKFQKLSDLPKSASPLSMMNQLMATTTTTTTTPTRAYPDFHVSNSGNEINPDRNKGKVDSELAEFLDKLSITDQTEALNIMKSVEKKSSLHSMKYGGGNVGENGKSSNDGINDDEQDLHRASSGELGQLSQKQRELVLHDLHGISTSDGDDSPLAVQKALMEMNTCIEQILRSSSNSALPLNYTSSSDSDSDSNTNSTQGPTFCPNTIYDFCQSQNPAYLQDWKFRLMFLRSVRMDPQLAAKKLFKFLEQKLALFGPSLLCENITLNHFSKDDLDFLRRGPVHLAPSRDRAGRAVIVLFPTMFSHAKTHENALRCFYYTIMLSLKDEETQKSGVVIVIDACSREGHSEPTGRPDPMLFMKCTKLVDAIPFKITGRHFCTNNNLYGFFVSYTSRFHQQSVRVRSRVHVGSHIECMYSLMTFGIPVDRLPTAADSTGLKAGRHVKFLNLLRLLETGMPFFKTEYGNNREKNSYDGNNNINITSKINSYDGIPAIQSAPFTAPGPNNPDTTMVLVPNHSDILFGRGKPIQMHPGNVWLGSIVEEMVPLYYQESSREGKAAVAQEVIRQVKARGGRFLKQYQDGNGIWMEVNDEQGQEKVCTAFRSCRATQRKDTGNNTGNNTGNSSNRPSSENDEVMKKRFRSM